MCHSPQQQTRQVRPASFIDRFHRNPTGTGTGSDRGITSSLWNGGITMDLTIGPPFSFRSLITYQIVSIENTTAPYDTNECWRGSRPLVWVSPAGKIKCSLPGSNWRSSDCSWKTRLILTMRPTLYRLSQGSIIHIVAAIGSFHSTNWYIPSR